MVKVKVNLDNLFLKKCEQGFFQESLAISLINIYYFLSKKNKIKYNTFQIKSKEYKEFCELSFFKMCKKLGLKIVKKFKSISNLFYENEGGTKRKTIPLPILTRVYDEFDGLKYVCIIDFDSKSSTYTIPNFTSATNSKGLISQSKLYLYGRKTGESLIAFKLDL
jgi:hypothetical protein